MNERSRSRARFLSSKELDEAAREIGKAAGGRVVAAGGYAMQIYGSDRLTTDLDVVGLRMPEQLPKLRPLSFGGYATRTSSGIPVDVIVRRDAFKKLYQGAVKDARTIPGVPIRVIGFGYLVAMKMIAGRPKDDLDLEFLLARMTKAEREQAKVVVVRYLGEYAGKELDAVILEALWKRSRDPSAQRRVRYRGRTR